MLHNRYSRLFAQCAEPGVAWLLLTGALALHVTDEAAHDFLSTYNPIVRSLRERVGLLPFPTFTFEAWLTGLIAGLILLSALSPLAFRRAAWLRPVALVLSVLMVANAGLHMAGSLFLGTVVPGTYTAPLLLAAAVCLFIAATRRWRIPPTAAIGDRNE